MGLGLMEGCLKSHFSHICNEVEKTTLGDLIMERFLELKSSQDREKVVWKMLQKSTRFFIRFLNDLGSILDPTGDLKILYFSTFLALGAKRVTKVLQDTSRSRFFKNLVPFWGAFWKNFQRFSNTFLDNFEEGPEKHFLRYRSSPHKTKLGRQAPQTPRSMNP